MSEITDEQIAKWERLAEAATLGPWEAKAYDYQFAGAPEVVWHAAYPDGEDTSDGRECDARFVAAARTALPALLAEVRRLREMLPGDGEALVKVPYLEVSQLAGDVRVVLDTDINQSDEVWLEGYQIVAMGKPGKENDE